MSYYNIPLSLCQTNFDEFHVYKRARKGKEIHRLLLCLQHQEGIIVIHYLREGIFYPLGNYTPQEADKILACYEKYGELTLCQFDLYSGFYFYDHRIEKMSEQKAIRRIKAL